MASAVGQPNFSFNLILISLNLKSSMAPMLDHAGRAQFCEVCLYIHCSIGAVRAEVRLFCSLVYSQLLKEFSKYLVNVCQASG